MLPCLVVAGVGRPSSDQIDIQMLSCFMRCDIDFGVFAGGLVGWLKALCS